MPKLKDSITSAFSEFPEVVRVHVGTQKVIEVTVLLDQDHYSEDLMHSLLDEELKLFDQYPDFLFDVRYIPQRPWMHEGWICHPHEVTPEMEKTIKNAVITSSGGETTWVDIGEDGTIKGYHDVDEFYPDCEGCPAEDSYWCDPLHDD